MIVADKNRWRVRCQHCGGGPMAVVQKQRAVTLRGVLALMVFMLGVTLMAITLVPGIVLVALSLIFGLSGNRKYNVLVCADCGRAGREL